MHKLHALLQIQKVNLYICYNIKEIKGVKYMKNTGLFPERNVKQIIKNFIDAILQLL